MKDHRGFFDAPGGDVVIGIEDDGCITGINGNEDHLNELLRVPFDYCIPSVDVEVHFVDCIDVNGKPNRVLVIHVEPSMRVHANQADDAFYRVVINKESKTIQAKRNLLDKMVQEQWLKKPQGNIFVQE